eukprot:TRINITY_DN49594_c0_g1_i1.p1 TRINITY_DN49594_c0_g1~~TRINITY_DN49594_c0_g1_i1.p1  ORF type:complete len:844 (-),score=129.89 TRINITY_DN49594_c0_g1_i1:77-2608(-)
MPVRTSRKSSVVPRTSIASGQGDQSLHTWLASGVQNAHGQVGAHVGNLTESIGGIVQRQDSEGNVFAELPIMRGGGEVLIDDGDAAVIMVMDYCPDGDKDDKAMDELVDDPIEQATKIFDRRINIYSKASMQTGMDQLQKGPVTFRQYRDVVRAKALELMEVSGLKITSITSVDNDQVLLRLSLNREGDVIQQLAERFDFDKQFTFQAYHCMDGLGQYYPGGAPPKNAEGDDVAAYASFRQVIASRFLDFDMIDETRIIFAQLNDWMKLPEMMEQNIIWDCYPATDFDKMCELSTEWANFSYVHHLPTHHYDDLVRDYFGEKVAFFFKFWAFYIRCLVPLAIFSFLCWAVTMIWTQLIVERSCNFLYFLAIIVWSGFFNQFFANHMSRDRQMWGMENLGKLAIVRVDYDPFLEGTTKMKLINLLVITLTLGFIATFIGILSLIAYTGKKAKENGQKDYSALLTTITMQLGNFLFGKFAPIWVRWQNHRTEDRYDESLNLWLMILKLFIGLYPLLNLAFLVNYQNPECGATLEAAADAVYKGHWPPGTPGDKNFSWLDKPTFVYQSRNRTCIYGCFPAECETVEASFFTKAGEIVCTTNCVQALEGTLTLNFLIDTISQIVFILIPVVIIRWGIHSEMSAINQKRDDPNHDEDRHYSLLQVQARQQEVTPYRFKSWGGSDTEDFLPAIIAFATVTCFGMMKPLLAVLAFIFGMIDYRLRAFRMVNVTSRPPPDVRDGIGIWAFALESVSAMAVVINSCLVVYVMPPCRDFEKLTKFVILLVIEHLAFAFFIAVRVFIPTEPEDVPLLRDINADFLLRMRVKQPVRMREEDKFSFDKVDLSLKDD